ncbi:hypothetical protein [Aeromicrobium phragmitis]|nr:hypothetical protein [Aeromicrobium phragmitis]
MPIDKEWKTAPPAESLFGSERFTGLDANVLDFWRFAMSDLRVNNLRGYLAEFLVARAVGASGPRVEWDAYDVLAPDGTTIEVKSSAYLQVWEQRRPTAITFRGLKARPWNPRTGYADEATYNSDVYVFAIQTATTHETYDPLDIAQWEFYVVPRDSLAVLGFKTIRLSTLSMLAGEPVSYRALADAIRRSAKGGE